MRIRGTEALIPTGLAAIALLFWLFTTISVFAESTDDEALAILEGAGSVKAKTDKVRALGAPGRMALCNRLSSINGETRDAVDILGALGASEAAQPLTVLLKQCTPSTKAEHTTTLEHDLALHAAVALLAIQDKETVPDAVGIMRSDSPCYAIRLICARLVWHMSEEGAERAEAEAFVRHVAKYRESIWEDAPFGESQWLFEHLVLGLWELGDDDARKKAVELLSIGQFMDSYCPIVSEMITPNNTLLLPVLRAALTDDYLLDTKRSGLCLIRILLDNYNDADVPRAWLRERYLRNCSLWSVSNYEEDPLWRDLACQQAGNHIEVRSD